MKIIFKKPKLNYKTFNYYLLGILAIFTLLLIVKGSNTGFLTNIFANDVNFDDVVSQVYVKDTTTGKKTTRYFEDAYERCLVMYSDGSTPKTAGQVASAGRDLVSKGGINNGDTMGSHKATLDFVTGKAPSATQDLEMSYILALTINSDAESAAQFVKDSNDEGFIPIVRLCYNGGAGSCSFRSAQDIVTYFTAISNALDGDNEFVAVLGPNEPGSGEFTAFGLPDLESSYKIVTDWADQAATALQDFRVANGGNMLLAPGIFNMPLASVIAGKGYYNDRSHYLNGQIDASLYDYLLGNTYNVGGNLADYYYNEKIPTSGGALSFSMKEYAEENDLLTLITEFGSFEKGLPELEQAYDTLCNDETVDGILFFRPFPESELHSDPTVRQNPPIPADDVKKIMDSCSEIPKRPGGRSSSWYNCNFDSCSEPKVPTNSIATSQKQTNSVYNATNANSIASVVGTEPQSTSTSDKNKPSLLLTCSGVDCFATAQKSIQVWLPIKQTGGTSPLGTKTRSYISACVEAAKLNAGNDALDALNQFAGSLIDENGNVYPMPWLGSAINCASQLALSSIDFARFTGLMQQVSDGSIANIASKEAESDKARGLTKEINGVAPDFLTALFDGKTYAEERTICVKDKDNPDGKGTCYAKDQVLDSLTALRYYSPYDTPDRYKSPTDPKLSNFKFNNNRDDYIPGPEVKVGGPETTQYSASSVCYNYSQRSFPSYSGDMQFALKGSTDADKRIDCKINTNGRYQAGAFTASCNNLTIGQSFYDGTAGIPEAAKDYCFLYNPGMAGEKVYVKYKGTFADQPTFKIDQVYDALYREYQRIQTELSSRNLKIVFRENIGWRAEVDSIIRDGNKKTQYTQPYYYVGEDADNVACRNNGSDPTKDGVYSINSFIDNSIGKAKGTSTNKEYQYYNWLGYLDIIQEWISAYANNTVLPAETIELRPTIPPEVTRDPKATPVGQTDRSIFIKSTLANQFLSFPLLTCDEVDYLKRGLKLPDLNLPEGFTLPSDADLTCVTDVSDTRQEDKLATELCRRGYALEGVCENACLSTDGSNDGASNSNSVTKQKIASGGFAATIPATSDFFVTTDAQGKSEEISSFAVNNNLEVAINANYYDHNGQLGPVGPWGVDPNLFFVLPKDNGDYAFAFTKTSLKVAVPEAASFVVAESATMAIIKTSQLPQALWDKMKSSIKSIVGASAWVIQNGNIYDDSAPENKYKDLSDSQKPRTAIGWKNGGKDVVFLVLEKANLSNIGTELKALGVENAIVLDGGNSSQMYLKGGFTTAEIAQPSQLVQSQKVYFPSGSGRKVKIYIGAKTGLVSPTNPTIGDPSFKLQPPLSGKLTITSKYADARPGFNDVHSGVDFAAGLGTPIMAAADGKVVAAGFDTTGFGNYVKIVHSNGYTTLYAHMSEIRTTVGASVTAGSIIGLVGSTGKSTAAHLHFELRIDATCQSKVSDGGVGYCTLDPMLYLGDFIPNVGDLPFCSDSSDSNKNFKNIFELIEAAASSLGIPKEILATIMSSEGRSKFELSIGDYIKSGSPFYTGNPEQRAYETCTSYPNTEIYVNVKGPTQLLCSTFTAYGVAPGTDLQPLIADKAQLGCPNVPEAGCAAATAGVGSRFEIVKKCIEDLGMSVPANGALDRTQVGTAICVTGAMFKYNNETIGDIPDMTSIADGANVNNPIWIAGLDYLCGGSQFCRNSSLGIGYANQTLGKFTVLRKYWDKFVTGEYGSKELYNYCITLGIQGCS